MLHKVAGITTGNMFTLTIQLSPPCVCLQGGLLFCCNNPGHYGMECATVLPTTIKNYLFKIDQS